MRRKDIITLYSAVASIRTAFCTKGKLYVLTLLVGKTVLHRWTVSVGPGGKVPTKSNRNTVPCSWNTCHSYAASTTNPTRTGPESNLGFRTERPTTNRLSYDAASVSIKLSDPEYLHFVCKQRIFAYSVGFSY